VDLPRERGVISSDPDRRSAGRGPEGQDVWPPRHGGEPRHASFSRDCRNLAVGLDIEIRHVDRRRITVRHAARPPVVNDDRAALHPCEKASCDSNAFDCSRRREENSNWTMHEIEHENATRSTSLLRIGGSCPVEVDGGHAWVLLGARPRADYRTKRTGPRSSKGVFVGDARLAFPADV